MNLDILKKYNIKAKKSLGQNFLVNEQIVEKIASSINVTGKNIVEVGPGYGALTQKLLDKKPKSLTLVELDKYMVEILESRINDGDLEIDGIEFNILNQDVLKYEPDFFSNSTKENVEVGYSVVANIPYYITSPILRHFLYDVKCVPDEMLILMQKDVGDKILGYGKGKSSVLSLFIAKKSYVQEGLFVGKQNFIPAPKIESSVLLFKRHNLYNNIDDKVFLDLIKKGFKEPRKKLLKNLVTSGFEKNKVLATFSKIGVDEGIRGENLNIETWIQLTKEIT